MYNQMTHDEVKHILEKNMFYNAIHLDTLNYMAEENIFAGGFCSDDAVIFADFCTKTNAQDVTNNIYVCPLKKNFDYVAAAQFIEKTFQAKSISVDVHLLEADTANAVKMKFSPLCPYHRELKDYVAKNEIATTNGFVRPLTLEDKDMFCNSGFSAMPNRPRYLFCSLFLLKKGPVKFWDILTSKRFWDIYLISVYTKMFLMWIIYMY